MSAIPYIQLKYGVKLRELQNGQEVIKESSDKLPSFSFKKSSVDKECMMSRNEYLKYIEDKKFKHSFLELQLSACQSPQNLAIELPNQEVEISFAQSQRVGPKDGLTIDLSQRKNEYLLSQR